MDWEFVVDGKRRSISVEVKDGKVLADFEGRSLSLDVHALSHRSFSLVTAGRSYLAHVARNGDIIYVSVGASRFRLRVPERGAESAHPAEGTPEKAEGTIKAPMPGRVIKVKVAEGNVVESGDGLVVVEAMKMEHEMRAAGKAIVKKVYVKEGEQVDAFQPLVELQPDGE
jgi:acetyl/propionyl-CoA carboxylase alpha subunit